MVITLRAISLAPSTTRANSRHLVSVLDYRMTGVCPTWSVRRRSSNAGVWGQEQFISAGVTDSHSEELAFSRALKDDESVVGEGV